MPQELEPVLRDLPLLANLPRPQLARLSSRSTMESLVPGTLLFREHERPCHLHILLRGIVELSKMEGRKECGVMLLSGGDLCMPAAAMFDEPYLTSARALTDCRLLMIEADAVRCEIGKSLELSLRLNRILGGQWRMAVRNILDLKCRSGPQRLAALLLRIADESPAGEEIELPFAKRHLASRVGITPESLSRSLQALADNGLHLRGNRILVRDRYRIEQFCGPDPYAARAEAGLDVHLL